MWQPIDSAPNGVSVQVKCEGFKPFLATLVRDASIDENERPCDQWQADTDTFPGCWSDGACWASNADGVMSKQPQKWRQPPEQGQSTSEARG